MYNKMLELELIPCSDSQRCCAARVKIARKLRQAGVILAPGYTTHDLLTFWKLSGVQERLKKITQRQCGSKE